MAVKFDGKALILSLSHCVYRKWLWPSCFRAHLVLLAGLLQGVRGKISLQSLVSIKMLLPL